MRILTFVILLLTTACDPTDRTFVLTVNVTDSTKTMDSTVARIRVNDWTYAKDMELIFGSDGKASKSISAFAPRENFDLEVTVEDQTITVVIPAERDAYTMNFDTQISGHFQGIPN